MADTICADGIKFWRVLGCVFQSFSTNRQKHTFNWLLYRTSIMLGTEQIIYEDPNNKLPKSERYSADGETTVIGCNQFADIENTQKQMILDILGKHKIFTTSLPLSQLILSP